MKIFVLILMLGVTKGVEDGYVAEVYPEKLRSMNNLFKEEEHKAVAVAGIPGSTSLVRFDFSKLKIEKKAYSSNGIKDVNFYFSGLDGDLISFTEAGESWIQKIGNLNDEKKTFGVIGTKSSIGPETVKNQRITNLRILPIINHVFTLNNNLRIFTNYQSNSLQNFNTFNFDSSLVLKNFIQTKLSGFYKLVSLLQNKNTEDYYLAFHPINSKTLKFSSSNTITHFQNSAMDNIKLSKHPILVNKFRSLLFYLTKKNKLILGNGEGQNNVKFVQEYETTIDTGIASGSTDSKVIDINPLYYTSFIAILYTVKNLKYIKIFEHIKLQNHFHKEIVKIGELSKGFGDTLAINSKFQIFSTGNWLTKNNIFLYDFYHHGCPESGHNIINRQGKCQSIEEIVRFCKVMTPFFQKCEKCFSPTAYTYSETECKPTCTITQAINPEKIKCIECNTVVKHCTRCSHVENKCSACETGYVLDNKLNLCLLKCKVDENPNKANTACVKCSTIDPQCNRCKDFAQSCTACNTGFEVGLNQKKCLKKCNIDQNVNKNNDACINCDKFVSKCNRCETHAQTCKACVASYTLDNVHNKCLYPCKENQNINQSNDGCINCDKFVPFCTRCQNFGEKCKKCKDGYKLDETLNKCIFQCAEDQNINQKNTGCLNCNKININCIRCQNYAQDCKKCDPGYLLDEVKDTCTYICDVDQNVNQKNNGCLECSKINKNCIRCKNFAQDCIKCDPGFRLDKEKNTCTKICEINQNVNKENNACLDCNRINKNCIRCQNFAQDCKKCDSGYLLDEEKDTCTYICDSDQNINRKNNGCLNCSKIDKWCTRCNNFATECTKCKEGEFEIYKKDGIVCKRICPQEKRWHLSVDKCKRCDEVTEGCAECQEFDLKCLKCKEGYEMEGEKCHKLLKIKLKNKKYDLEHKVIELEFDTSIEIEKKNDLVFELFDPQSGETFAIQASKLKFSDDNKTLKIHYDFEFNFENFEIRIKQKNERTIISQNSKYKFFEEFPINVSGVSNPEEKEPESPGILKPLYFGLKVTATILSFSSAPFFLFFIKLTQMFEYLNFLNIRLPSNAKNVLKIFSTNYFETIPNLIEFDDLEVGEVHPKFDENEFGSSAFNNTTNLLQNIFFLLLVKLFTKISLWAMNGRKKDKRYLEKKIGFFKKVCYKVNDGMNYEFLVNFVIAAQMDFIGGSAGCLYYLRSKGTYVIIDLVYAVFLMVFYLFFFNIFIFSKLETVVQIKRSKKLDKHHKKSKAQEWSFLVENYKESALLKIYIFGINFLLDASIPLSVIFGVKAPKFQVLCLFLIVLCKMLTFLLFLPLESKKELFVTVINFLLYLISVVFFYVIYLKQGNISEDELHDKYGVMLSVSLITIVVFNLLIALIDLVITILEHFKKEKKKVKKSAISSMIEIRAKRNFQREIDEVHRKRERRRKEKERRAQEQNQSEIKPFRQVIEELKNFDSQLPKSMRGLDSDEEENIGGGSVQKKEEKFVPKKKNRKRRANENDRKFIQNEEMIKRAETIKKSPHIQQRRRRRKKRKRFDAED